MIEIYTDGASKGNPGKGGYGIVMFIKDQPEYKKEFSEGYRLTTNNRMELLAVIQSLKMIKDNSCTINLYSDSKYVVESINKNWAIKWELKNYVGVKNSDLWIILLKLIPSYNINFFWIKGHFGNIYNERADELAVKAYEYEADQLNIDINYESTIKNK